MEYLLKLRIPALGFLLFSLVYVLYLTSASSPSFLSENQLEYEEFLKFSENFSKKYLSSDMKYRFEVYKENLKVIREYNSISKDFVLAPNKFADLTKQEFTDLYSSNFVESRRLSEVEDFVSPLGATPSVWDWRDQGAVSDVIFQGNCDSSWAISVVGAIEGARVSQAGLDLVALSSQEVLDCVVGESQGCGGGVEDDAYLFAQNYGLTTALNYPYTGVNQTCNQTLVSQNITYITSSVYINSFSSSSLLNGVAISPVVSYLETDSYVWQFYYSGVITGFCGNDLNSYVLIVGFNQVANVPYFTAKNSLGQDWGESGYVRIGIYGSNGICGINTISSYPIISNS